MSDYYSLGLCDVTRASLLDRYSCWQGGPAFDGLVFVRFCVRKRHGVAAKGLSMLSFM